MAYSGSSCHPEVTGPCFIIKIWLMTLIGLSNSLSISNFSEIIKNVNVFLIKAVNSLMSTEILLLLYPIEQQLIVSHIRWSVLDSPQRLQLLLSTKNVTSREVKARNSLHLFEQKIFRI